MHPRGTDRDEHDAKPREEGGTYKETEPDEGDDDLEWREPDRVEHGRQHHEELRVVRHQILDLSGVRIANAGEAEALAIDLTDEDGARSQGDAHHEVL